ncbi:hypothetical protein [Desulfosporosinus youngiae]|uniref:Uncharacterized protein n=1 Tax=Desulfosporosinus youngiae DSM 17734 TaxID=768710 RepID=H5XTF4_9FIRM|nr:hypothetical protein [Desulfosporosinus youngiae]EHQ88413.1 hypothetical protein DesyoDRAFT_1245 [Desulfosporosinus youngiae DSM 17734]
MKTQYLVIPVSDEDRKRLNYVCTKLGITIEQFFNTALREGELEILSTDAFKQGGAFWNIMENPPKNDSE